MMRRLAVLTLLALVGLALAELYVDITHYEQFALTNLIELTNGQADRPFVFRQLAPLATALLAHLAGLDLVTAGRWIIRAGLVGWLWALWALAREGLSERAALWAAVTAALPVGLLFLSGGFIYDVPHLALFTLALALMAHGRWRLYLALFPLVVLSKETALLLVGVYGLARRNWRGAGVQLVIFAALKALLQWRFAANPGGLYQNHLDAHAVYLVRYALPNVLALCVYGGGVWAALHRWVDKPPLLRAAGLTIPAMFVAFYLFGFPGEIRAVLEAYPALYLLAFHTVWHRAARPTYRWLSRLSTARTTKASSAAASISQ